MLDDAIINNYEVFLRNDIRFLCRCFVGFFFFYIVLEKTSVSAAEFYHMTYDQVYFDVFFLFFLLLLWAACI